MCKGSAAMLFFTEGNYTIDDIYALPEGERAELTSRKMDYNTKNTLYAESGVREYWIVDPDKERTTIYYYEEDAAPMIVPFDQPIHAGIYKDLSINISELLK